MYAHVFLLLRQYASFLQHEVLESIFAHRAALFLQLPFYRFFAPSMLYNADSLPYRAEMVFALPGQPQSRLKNARSVLISSVLAILLRL